LPKCAGVISVAGRLGCFLVLGGHRFSLWLMKETGCILAPDI
jgi:hypothetical protein